MDLQRHPQRYPSGQFKAELMGPYQKGLITLLTAGIIGMFGWIMAIQAQTARLDAVSANQSDQIQALQGLPERMSGLEEKVEQIDRKQDKVMESQREIIRALGRLEGRNNGG